MLSELSEKIDLCRDNLHRLICSENLESELVLIFSQELDQLILEYTKKRGRSRL